ncbi:uncharacterized protein LOC131207291 [Anopheles bellator]|uniref:uncharacterized protein LOC131207291 n=1 Tax=Anopheles bellator TaxID=139047 RepID=UPI002647B8A1|nr:uncharacterized protein LOC131207291 [Anopheles bellator]
MMADTPTNTGSHANAVSQQASATDPTVIPQWKKELIQRRKNLAKTIGAVATQVHDSASTVAAAISAASSPVLAHPRTPTGGVGAFPVGSPFYAGVATKATSPTAAGFTATTAVGVHAPNEQPTDHQHYPPYQHPYQQRNGVGVGVGGRAPESVVVSSAATGGLALGSHGSVAANGVQSNSNAGAEHNGGSSSSVAAAATTASRTVSVEQQQSPQQPPHQPIGSSSSSKPPFLVSGSAALSNGQQQQQQGLLRDGVAARKMVAATATEEIIVYEKSVISEVDGEELGGGGGVGGGQFGLGDAGEELKYGPGIVSRLRCRYLSLALRQSVAKQRPSLNSMRRATSLNNLLDEESEDLSEREQSIGSEGCGGGGAGGPGGAHGGQQQQKKYHTQSYHHTQQQQQQHLYANGNNHHNHLIHQQPPHHPQQPLGPTVVLQPPAGGYQKKQPWHYNQPASEEQQTVAAVVSKAAAPFLRGVQNSYTRASRQVEKKNDYNRYTKHHRGGSGGADSVLLKRARSVEALVRYDHKAWERDVTGTTRTSTAAAAALATATPATPPVVPSSVVETDSNVIILDEIAPTAPATTTTTAATPNGGTIAGEQHHHNGSNGISSSAAPILGTSPTMMMNGGGGGGGGGGRMAVDLLVSSDCVTIEEKIINGREKGDPKPKRLTSFIDADERPPPDVVKQTMKIFEANANRRGPASQRIPVATAAVPSPAGGEVATKVASYRSIIIATPPVLPAGAGITEKPPITHPKPPLSPKKPNIKPRTASPKHQQQVPPIVVVSPQAVTAKPPPTPKSLEAVNNLKNAAGTLRNGGSAPANQLTHPVGTEPLPLAVTPPSPPARSKHVSQQPPLSNINNTPVSNGGAGVGAKSAVAAQEGGFISHEAVATREPEPARKPNNGGGGGDHHHNDYENGGSSIGGGGGQNQHTHVVSSSTAPPPPPSTTTPLVRPLSSPSPPSSGGICDSPSLQQLTNPLTSLHLATSTPTGAPSSNGAAGTHGTERNSNGTSPTTTTVGDRRNLEYVTSEEDDDDEDGGGSEGRRTEYTVNPSESSEEDIAVVLGGGGGGAKDVRDGTGGYRSQVPLSNSENDADDDEDDEEEDEEEVGEQDRSVRKVSRTAMENIGRAGTTTQFRFNGATKSYLPGGTGGGTVSGKAPAPPIPIARESLLNAKPGAAPANEVTGVSTGSGGARGGGGASAGSNASKSDVVGGGGSIGVDAAPGGSSGGGGSGVVRAPEAPLTRREIEKNQINRERSGEPGAATNNNNSNNGGVHNNNSNSGNGKMKMMMMTGGAGAGGASVEKSKAATTEPPRLGGGSGSAVTDNSTSSFVAKWGTAAGQSPQTAVAPAATAAAATTTPAIRKKPKPPPSQQQEASNTMVFNFSDRKDVPDYIENDGVIIRPRPRELPKPGESGFVVLGDLTLETSTDPDDAWAMGPPSPCNGEFANAYIVINGKSSMRNKTSRSNKFKIQFDDSLTSTYEYPSETSLLETNGFDDADSGSGPDNFGGAATDSGLLSHTNKLLSSVPLGSAPFASYTPVKAAIDTTFELGVTRTPSPSAASTASSTGSSNGSNSTSSSRSSSSNNNNSSHQQHSATSHSDSHYLQHSLSGATIQAAVAATAAATINGNGYGGPGSQLLDRPNNLHSNGHHGDAVTSATARLLNGDVTTLCGGGTGEPESIQYLKPASDEQTVNWSQGTRVTDLLF